MEISNTGCRQDDKAEATQAESSSTSMTVSLVMCVSAEGKGEQKGVKVYVRGANNAWICDFRVHVCGCLVTGLCQCVYITSLRGGEGVH